MNKDFSRQFRFDRSPQEVFDAVCNVRGWWSTLVEGNTTHLGDTFIYRHKDLHASTQELTTIIKNEKVEWLVTDSHLSFLKEKKDAWTGTTISFEIIPGEANTTLRFTHHGLNPAQECYQACSGGWDFYLGSLVQLINTGEGRPDL